MKVKTESDIHFLLSAHFPSAALAAALERGLFWEIDDRPRSVESLAKSLGIPLAVCRYWLRLLESLGIVEETQDSYGLTTVSHSAIIKSHEAGTWSELAREERLKWASDLALLEALFEPEMMKPSKKCVLGPEPGYVSAMRKDPQQAHRFTHMLYDLHAPLAKDIARQLELEDAKTLLDIGGGSGVVSLTLLAKHPKLTATVMDIPNVCAVGRQIADQTPVASRITYYPADFFLDAFPAQFDLILACDIMGYAQALINKAAAHLEAGGRFVIVDRWFEEPRDWSIGQSVYLLRRSLNEPEFFLPSFADLHNRLRQAGLEPIAREEIPYGRWQMIQARKME